MRISEDGLVVVRPNETGSGEGRADMQSIDEATAFRRASEGFVERARQIGQEQWSAATPCAEWNVRALVNHVAGEYLWVPEMVAGKTIAEVGDHLDGDVLGDDPVQTLISARRAALAAIDFPEALDRAVHLSFGDLPARAYVNQMALDSVIHSWDLARGIGADEALDPELVELCHVGLKESADAWRAAGVFGPEKAPSDDSLQAKLLALTGR
jgi:uncharacterized protein (TIGR03086 family)